MDVQPSTDERPARRATERGASLVEYSLLLTFIAIVALLAVNFFGKQLDKNFDESGSSLSAHVDTP